MARNAWQLACTTWSAAAAVIKGDSWLCSDSYCMRYRPAADRSLGTDHIGFRTVKGQGSI